MKKRSDVSRFFLCGLTLFVFANEAKDAGDEGKDVARQDANDQDRDVGTLGLDFASAEEQDDLNDREDQHDRHDDTDDGKDGDIEGRSLFRGEFVRIARNGDGAILEALDDGLGASASADEEDDRQDRIGDRGDDAEDARDEAKNVCSFLHCGFSFLPVIIEQALADCN